MFDVDVGVLCRTCTDRHGGRVQRLQGIEITVCEVVADVHVNYRSSRRDFGLWQLGRWNFGKVLASCVESQEIRVS